MRLATSGAKAPITVRIAMGRSDIVHLSQLKRVYP
jgi:hypothetical protein